ncbi:MAG: integration host factor subunit beta [Treponema sp.]|jgi:integration host factor subunit beta|nr:integration host factor subunit beta [Treponema sp.]
MTENKCTKADLIDAVYENTGIDREYIKLIVDNFVDKIKKALVDNMVIEMRGFGTFEVKVRKGRKRARNPKTGDIVSVDDHGRVIFRAGKELRQDVWNLAGEPDKRSVSGPIQKDWACRSDSASSCSL